jgi:hypothetical protein
LLILFSDMHSAIIALIQWMTTSLLPQTPPPKLCTLTTTNHILLPHRMEAVAAAPATTPFHATSLPEPTLPTPNLNPNLMPLLNPNGLPMVEMTVAVSLRKAVLAADPRIKLLPLLLLLNSSASHTSVVMGAQALLPPAYTMTSMFALSSFLFHFKITYSTQRADTTA